MSAPARVLELFFPRRKGLAGAVLRQRLWLILGVVAALVLIGLWTAPRLLSLAYLARGSRLLERAIHEAGLPMTSYLVCGNGMAVQGAARSTLRQSIGNLQKALGYNINNSHAYLQLGRAYCLMSQPGTAIKFYEAYKNLRPNNPLGHLELGFAYDLIDESEMALNEWGRAHMTVNELVAAGDENFKTNNFTQATFWYQVAASYFDLSPSTELKWLVAEIKSHSKLPESVKGPIPQYEFKDFLEFHGSELVWLPEDNSPEYGTPLSQYPSHDRSLGVMWWKGSAVFLVKCQETVTHRLTFRAVHRQSEVGEIQVEVNLNPIVKIKIPSVWREYQMKYTCQKGVQMIGIRYIEDKGDLILDWIRLETFKFLD